jgi:hypothetical protein
MSGVASAAKERPAAAPRTRAARLFVKFMMSSVFLAAVGCLFWVHKKVRRYYSWKSAAWQEFFLQLPPSEGKEKDFKGCGFPNDGKTGIAERRSFLCRLMVNLYWKA